MDHSKNSPLAALDDASLLRTQALINGEWVAGSERFAVVDPATGAQLAEVANLGAGDAEAAIAAAQNAFGPCAVQGLDASASVLDGQGQAQLVPVNTAELVNSQYRITSGLNAGQRVVIEGIDRLTPGTQVIAHPWQSPAVSQQADAGNR